jgi:hypothetical protein
MPTPTSVAQALAKLRQVLEGRLETEVLHVMRVLLACTGAEFSRSLFVRWRTDQGRPVQAT